MPMSRSRPKVCRRRLIVGCWMVRRRSARELRRGPRGGMHVMGVWDRIETVGAHVDMEPADLGSEQAQTSGNQGQPSEVDHGSSIHFLGA